MTSNDATEERLPKNKMSTELFANNFYHLEGGVTGLDQALSTHYFQVLRDNVDWIEGVRSRFRGFTRLARPIVDESELTMTAEGAIVSLLEAALVRLRETGCMSLGTQASPASGGGVDGFADVKLHGIYLNYYRDGEMYTPAHRHVDTTQIIISLGGERTLTVGSKSYPVRNGDIVVLKSQLHGVPKADHAEPRISVVAFVDKKTVHDPSL